MGNSDSMGYEWASFWGIVQPENRPVALQDEVFEAAWVMSWRYT
jgi:hypothetical protein